MVVCKCTRYQPKPTPTDLDAARAWLEANTPLRWATEPDPECPDVPIEDLNRRQERQAKRLADYAAHVLAEKTPGIRAEAVKELFEKMNLHELELSDEQMFYVIDRLRQVAKEMTEEKDGN